MQSKNYHHPQISKNYDPLWDQFIIWENLSPTYRNCVFHLDLFLTKIIWTDKHDEQFKLIKQKNAETTENKHLNHDLETRIKCDAARKSLGCALEQRTPNGWHTVAFASQFLNSVEDRYSINELELLGVVWSIEHFK